MAIPYRNPWGLDLGQVIDYLVARNPVGVIGAGLLSGRPPVRPQTEDDWLNWLDAYYRRNPEMLRSDTTGYTRIKDAPPPRPMPIYSSQGIPRSIPRAYDSLSDYLRYVSEKIDRQGLVPGTPEYDAQVDKMISGLTY